MLKLDFAAGGSSPLSILCVGAHCDDIEIGCGATLLELTRRRSAQVRWVIFSSNATRAAEARQSATGFLSHATQSSMVIKEYRDGFLPYSGAVVKDEFEALKAEVSPDLIFTHYRHDLHQDHRLISELTWNTFRDHLILEYEIPKWDGDVGSPNVFVTVSQETAQRKVTQLLQSYGSQASKRWFTADTFMALLRLRGLESNADSGLAEAFYGRKLNLTP